MPVVIETPTGPPLLIQPAGEHRRQQAVGYGFAALAFGSAILVAWITLEAPAVPLVVLVPIMGMAGLGALAFWGALRQRAYTLFENGIRLPSGKFLPYRNVRDMQRIEHPNRKTKFLVLAQTDSTFGVIGSTMTKNVLFSTAQFDAVAALVLQGVEREGAKPDIDWDPELWGRIGLLSFRGPVIVNTEKYARDHGVWRVDQAFLDDAVLKDRRIRFWLRAATRATARTQFQPKRNATPYDPRG